MCQFKYVKKLIKNVSQFSRLASPSKQTGVVWGMGNNWAGKRKVERGVTIGPVVERWRGGATIGPVGDRFKQADNFAEECF